MTIIGLEEHFVTSAVLDAWQGVDPRWQEVTPNVPSAFDISGHLADLGGMRLDAMDDTGLDVQVLSLTTPGLQTLEAAEAVALQVEVNDQMAEAVRQHPNRYQGFATLATPDPGAAAAELERAVTTLGFNGAMLFSRTRGRTLDHPDFLPIFEAAAALKAPLYLHPQTPPAEVRAAYYSGLPGAADQAFATFGIGWHYDVGVQLIRLIVAGVFDRFPDLQVIVGHWGEVVMFYLDRLAAVGMIAQLPRPIADYFQTNVFITPSGLFSQRYLRWTLEVVGVDRILYSTDYPFVYAPGGGAKRFLDEAGLSDEDRDKIASGNWNRLVAGIRR